MDRVTRRGSHVTPYIATIGQPRFEGRGRHVADQARAGALLATLLLCACAVPEQINPRLIGRDVSGAAAESRLPPPGLDRPSGNLASVPPVPERPDPTARAALTRQLQLQRDALAVPLFEGRADTPLTESEAPGQPPIPASPPRPATLARAPVIPWATAAPAAPRGVDEPAPEQIIPGEVPALPTADILAPPPLLLR